MIWKLARPSFRQNHSAKETLDILLSYLWFRARWDFPCGLIPPALFVIRHFLVGLPAPNRSHGVLSVGKQDAKVILIQAIIHFVSVYRLFHQLLEEGKKLLRLTGSADLAG